MSSPVARVSLAELQEPVRSELERVQRDLRRIIEADFQLIRDVNSHLLQMQGKLFRPTIMLLADQATGSAADHAGTLAAVVELIHLATLVHDDSVDHSVLRRGMPTINSLFSHQISVIMGDYLYSRAVIELVRLNQFEALRVLSRVTNEMTVGEMRQLLAHDPLSFSEEQYDLLIRAKTASLLAGAAELGALKAPAPQRAAVQRFGEALGMAFQIVDDLLDFTGDEVVLGKPVGGDLREGKMTLPVIHLLASGDARAEILIRKIVTERDASIDEWRELRNLLAQHRCIDHARRVATEFVDKAKTALDIFPASAERDALIYLPDYVLSRDR